MGWRTGEAALPTATARPARGQEGDFGRAREEASGLEASGLLGARRPGHSLRGQEGPRGHRCYLTRNPLSLKKLVWLDGQKAVLYRSRMNPSLGRNFEAMDPLEWLVRMADHIPTPASIASASMGATPAAAGAP